MSNRVYKAIRRPLYRRVRSASRPLLFRHPSPPPELRLEKIGSGYGGWIVPTAVMNADWLCYCGGVGEDVTFDKGVIERFGLTIHAFDPTPRSAVYVEKHLAGESRFTLHRVGLYDKDTVLRFYVPRNPKNVSHSVVNLQRTSEYFEAEVRSLPSVMKELGHDRIDLLKIDIEGAEHFVIKSILEAGIRPDVICLEIDQPVHIKDLWGTVRRIKAADYALVAVDSWNLTFIRKDTLARWTAQLRAHATTIPAASASARSVGTASAADSVAAPAASALDPVAAAEESATPPDPVATAR